MDSFNSADHPHRRYNPLADSWVLVSPHRAKRPWQGQVEKTPPDQKPAYDPTCYLCPGNERAGGKRNPDYTDTFSFVNDYSALLENTPEGNVDKHELIKAESLKGLCKVICFSPRHDLTIPEMEVSQIKKVVNLWAREYQDLGSRDFINYIQIFENKGAIMGCSNPHPHGQIWSQSIIPMEPAKKTLSQEKYFKSHGNSLLSDYLKNELEGNDRIVTSNEHFVALVPFWAIWPFETMIISRRHIQHIGQMSDTEKEALADIYKRLTVKYDNLFEVSFPYSAGIHQSPTDGKNYKSWHFHMSFYPPLLRSATVKKFWVGYEMLAEPQRDITAETSAGRLRELPDLHYKKGEEEKGK